MDELKFSSMVEWKTIENSCKTITPPKKLEKELYSSDGLYPIIDQGQRDLVGYTNDASALVPQGEYVLFGDHTRYVKYHKGQFAQGADGLKILQSIDSILPRYFFYAFENTDVPSRGYSRHWSIAKGLQIPIPSLSEQTRIVGILDTFTSAIDNLKEQIAQRRKQYEYYRDELLDLEGKERVEWKKLGDVANLVRGKVISKDYIRDFGGEFPVYSSQTANDGVLGKINSYMFDGDYLTWTTDGAYAGTIFRRKGKFSITNVCGLIDISCSNIQQDFLYFWLSKTAKDYVLEGMGNPKLMSNVASTIKIPIPPLQEQQRIVSILDTFEASIKNLEAQLKEREKQYEYYRNQLLTFE